MKVFLATLLLSGFIFTSVDSAKAQTEVSGDVSGVWTLSRSPYLATNHITVPFNQTLEIRPGVRILFRSHYKFNVNGLLRAIGKPDSMITFARFESPINWHGIRFSFAHDSCVVRYCRIQNGSAFGSFEDKNGAAIHCSNSSPRIENCIINDNTTFQDTGEGTIYCIENSSPQIRGCTFSDNFSRYEIVIMGTNVSAIITRNNFQRVFDSGIRIGQSVRAIITQNVLVGTEPARGGSGMGINLPGSGESLVSNNVVSSFVIGIASSAGSFRHTITNNTVHSNRFDGIRITGKASVFENNIVAGAGNSRGIYLPDPSNRPQVIAYNNVWGSNPNWLNYPSEFGRRDTVNANGDSCDTYFNISFDPMFVDPFVLDLHLKSTSLCIDAGDPAFPKDPDSTRSDIGAFYYNQLGTNVYNKRENNFPGGFALGQNYPNPFNPTTTIRYAIPTASYVILKVYNLLGNKIETIVNEKQSAGEHEIKWNAGGFPSGVYVYRFQAGEFVVTKKLILLK